MESSEVVITLRDEHNEEQRFVYTEPWICLVGRAQDCDIQIPSDEGFLEISRHHCLLEINPPSVRIRDLGSTNGTFVNGQRIGRRASRLRSPNDTDRERAAATTLHDGDEIQLARTPVRLSVEVHAGDLQSVGSNEEFDAN